MPKVKEAVAVISEVAVKGSVWRSLAFYLLKLSLMNCCTSDNL